MAAKKTNKGRKGVARAKAARKTSVRTARKSPKLASEFPPRSIEIF